MSFSVTGLPAYSNLSRLRFGSDQPPVAPNDSPSSAPADTYSRQPVPAAQPQEATRLMGLLEEIPPHNHHFEAAAKEAYLAICREGDVPAFKRLETVLSQANPAQWFPSILAHQDVGNDTGLHLAIQNGHVELLEALGQSKVFEPLLEKFYGEESEDVNNFRPAILKYTLNPDKPATASGLKTIYNVLTDACELGEDETQYVLKSAFHLKAADIVSEMLSDLPFAEDWIHGYPDELHTCTEQALAGTTPPGTDTNALLQAGMYLAAHQGDMARLERCLQKLSPGALASDNITDLPALSQDILPLVIKNQAGGDPQHPFIAQITAGLLEKGMVPSQELFHVLMQEKAYPAALLAAHRLADLKRDSNAGTGYSQKAWPLDWVTQALDRTNDPDDELLLREIGRVLITRGAIPYSKTSQPALV